MADTPNDSGQTTSEPSQSNDETRAILLRIEDLLKQFSGQITMLVELQRRTAEATEDTASAVAGGSSTTAIGGGGG